MGDSNSLMNEITYKQKLRSMLIGLVNLINSDLFRYNPVCKECFHDRGLVDICTCGGVDKKNKQE